MRKESARWRHRCRKKIAGRGRPGSKLIAALRVVKRAGFQINYGSGKGVSDETMADAGGPLRLQWLDTSYLDIPIRR